LYSEPPEVALLPVTGLPAAPRAGAHRREDPVLQAEVGMEQFEYLLVLAGCLAITAPLEFFGARVYRRPVRLARAVLPVAAVFLVWDAIAIANRVWSYNPEHMTGVRLPLAIPLEEFLFFLVIPVCAVLTYSCVQAMLRRLRTGRRTQEPAGEVRS
jgi:lycopene cyclase domain-containing protein